MLNKNDIVSLLHCIIYSARLFLKWCPFDSVHLHQKRVMCYVVSRTSRELSQICLNTIGSIQQPTDFDCKEHKSIQWLVLSWTRLFASNIKWITDRYQHEIGSFNWRNNLTIHWKVSNAKKTRFRKLLNDGMFLHTAIQTTYENHLKTLKTKILM